METKHRIVGGDVPYGCRIRLVKKKIHIARCLVGLDGYGSLKTCVLSWECCTVLALKVHDVLELLLQRGWRGAVHRRPVLSYLDGGWCVEDAAATIRLGR